MQLSLAVPDWEDRIRRGLSLVPKININPAEQLRAVKMFGRLRLPDVPGQPTLEVACGDWFKDIVGPVLGSLDPETGARVIRGLFLLAPKKSSKALALDTQIATPSGFTTMGAVAVGDLVLDAAGVSTRVTAKSECFLGRPCFDVEFSTGETVTCDADHLWITDAHRDRERLNARAKRAKPRPSVKTTAAVAASITVPSGRYSINNHRTALCGALALPAAELTIPPYALGVWLGDGATDAALVTTGLQDADAIVERLVANGQPAYVRAWYPEMGSATITLGEPNTRTERLPYRFRTEAVKLHVLGNKHIPGAYLRASHDQRLWLLRGLMDTDGHVTTSGECVYTTTLPALRDDVRELIASLGFKPTYSEHRAILRGKDHGPYWRVRFTAFADTPVATIERKCRQKKRPERTARSESRQIVAVRPVKSVAVQCIAVESETKQYLVTRSLIPTHNTTYGAGMMMTALLMNRRPNGEFILTGPTHDISEIAYGAAEGMIEADDDWQRQENGQEGYLKKVLHSSDHLKTLEHRRTGASLKIKTFDMDVATGVKPVGVLVDELHVISKDKNASRVLGQLRGGRISNTEAFFAIITTQSDEPPVGVMATELSKARAIRDGRAHGDTLSVLYEFPPEIANSIPRWYDSKLWPMVTPNLGRSVTIDVLEKEFDEAKQSGETEIRRWASQHLNIEIGLNLRSNRWAGAEFWAKQADPELSKLKPFDALTAVLDRSESVVVGLDGGGLDDLFGFNALGPSPHTSELQSQSNIVF